MARVVVIGEPPQPVLDEIERTAGDVTLARAPLTAVPMKALAGADYLLLHIPAGATDQDRYLEWLSQADADRVHVGLTSVEGVTPVVSRLIFERAVRPIAPLNDGDEVRPGAVSAFLAELVTTEVVTDDDYKLGVHFAKSLDREAYHGQRMMSLASMSMQPFLEDLKDAVDSLSVPVPDAHAGDLPPWDPDGPVTAATTLPRIPSLRDVFRLRAEKPVNDRLAARSLWKPPRLLVLGESGSGKTLVAHLVRDLVTRRLGQRLVPYVTVNCGSLSDRNIEHEMFGSAGGVWATIENPVLGALARAAYGVAFLDEIGDLSPEVQRALLVYLQDGVVRPFEVTPFQGYTRVIAATNRDIPLLIDRQLFRNDLYERFSRRVTIPPLRERGPDELRPLIEFVALNPDENIELKVSHIGADAMAALLRHEYRNGNFRELETIIHGGLAQARRRGSTVLRARDLSFSDVRTVADAHSRTIRVSAAPPHDDVIQVDGAADLDRLATLTGKPVLVTPQGERFVIHGGQVYRG